MGEIFELTMPESDLEFTGERFTTSASGQIEIEHLHRYFIARELCRGKDVLDVASGEGYGTALLAQVARSATGVEISDAAVAHAAQTYVCKNLTYLQGDARKIPLPDGAVDIVVSFETIEHFYEHELFVGEVKRVLRPGGLFIVSSPQRDIYSPAGSNANPYHVHELSRGEFDGLLKRFFKTVHIMGQRPLVGSVILPDRAEIRRTMVFERRGGKYFEASTDLPRAIYDVAIASDAPTLDMPASVYIESDEVGNILSRAKGFPEALSEIDRLNERAEAAEAAYAAAQEEIALCVEQARSEKALYVEQAQSALLKERAWASEEISRQLAAAVEEGGLAEAIGRGNLRAIQACHAEIVADLNKELDKARAQVIQEQEIANLARAEANAAASQRDSARMVAQRSVALAERDWRELSEKLKLQLVQAEQGRAAAEEQMRLWQGHYHRLRGLLERGLRVSGIYFVSRAIPRPVRKGIIKVLRG